MAVAYVAVMTGGELNPTAQATTWANSSVTSVNVPHRGEPDAWGRNRAALEGAMTLFQMGDRFSSKEIAGGTATVTLNRDHLAAYLATPFLGGETPISFALDSGVGHAFVVAQVLTRAFAAEQLAQNQK